MKGRGGIEQILSVLSVCSGMYVDHQASAQPGHPDRGKKLIDRGRSEDGEPDHRKARSWLWRAVSERTIELNRFQEAESMLGEECEFFETLGRRRNRQSGTQMPAEIRKRRQPAHHHRALQGVTLRRGCHTIRKVGRTAGLRGAIPLNRPDTSGSEGRLPEGRP